ncbi:MAG: zinc ABC transporter substrate-binding protein [Balneolales bacterium]
MNKLIYGLLPVLMTAVFACTSGGDRQNPGQLYVVATTQMIADAASVIANDLLETDGIMGPGVDPHLYRATPGDFRKMEEADLLLYNGLLLEGRLSDILEKMGDKAYAVSSSIPDSLLKSGYASSGNYDPHIWFDVNLWKYAVRGIGEQLAALEPRYAEEFEDNTNRYLAELDSLERFIHGELDKIPPNRKILITAHDAFGYFGDRYGLEVRALQGLSTVSEYGLQDVSRMVNYIIENDIPAIFVESSISTRSSESIIAGAEQRGHPLIIGGELYSDAMGAPGTDEGTYIGMFKHNVRTIAQALTKGL